MGKVPTSKKADTALHNQQPRDTLHSSYPEEACDFRFDIHTEYACTHPLYFHTPPYIVLAPLCLKNLL
jgi:hypothetical protein